MPWKTLKRDCRQATGKKGNYVIVKKKKDGGTEQESCHTSEEKAKSAIRARHVSEGKTMKITKTQLRKIIGRTIQENLNTENNLDDLDELDAVSGAMEPLSTGKTSARTRGERRASAKTFGGGKLYKEETSKTIPFGSGMEVADLNSDQKEIIGHT